MTLRELQRAVAVASTAAKEAGRLQLATSGRPKSVLTKRSAIDLVTEIDRRSEAIIRRRLLRAFPDHGFQGEEQTFLRPEAPYRWIVDPLDGTTNFVHGNLCFSVSIGLTHRGRPVAGVIYDPSRRELFSAVRGGGARLNGRRIRVSSVRRLHDGLLSTGFSVSFRKTPALFLGWFKAFQFKCHAVRRMGSTALSLANVACGREDGFYEQELWPWDIAAGILIVQEAGGRVTNFTGGPVELAKGQVLASNGRIHREMLAILSKRSSRR